MAIQDEILNYPDLINSAVSVSNFGHRLDISGKCAIQKPESMGLTKIIDEVFRSYEDWTGYDRSGVVKSYALKSFLDFSSDSERIRDKQDTHKYFYGNDELREHIKEGDVPKEMGFYFNPNKPHEYLHKVFTNKRLYVEYMKKLNRLVRDPTSLTLNKLKSFLDKVEVNEVADIDEQDRDVRDYDVYLSVSRSFGDSLSYGFNAKNSKGEVLDLNTDRIKSFGEKHVASVMSDFSHAVSKKYKEKFDSLEVSLSGLEDLTIEGIKKKFIGSKRTIIDKLGKHVVDKLRDILVGNVFLGWERDKSEKEVQKYSAVTSDFSRFWQNLRYFTHMGDYFHKLEGEGYKLCMPEIVDMEENVMEVKCGSSFNLMRNMSREEIVTNDIKIGKDRKHVYVITGPNKNGKTTFVNMFTGFQTAFQDGWYLPCESARVSSKCGIKSFFPEVVSEDDAESRFSYEGVRMKEIFKNLKDYCIVPIDEPFTSAPNIKTGDYLRKIVGNVMPHTPNVTYIITSHEHSLIDVVDGLHGGQNLKADSRGEGKNIKLLKKIMPGSSTVMNSDGLLEDIGADPDSLLGYIKNKAKGGKLTFK